MSKLAILLVPPAFFGVIWLVHWAFHKLWPDSTDFESTRWEERLPEIYPGSWRPPGW